MDYIKTFESFNFSIESLSKLNEAEIDSVFQDAFKNVLGGAKITDTPSAEIKKNLQTKLSGIKNSYKASLKEYIKDKYDQAWYESILNIVSAPGQGFISITGTKSEGTEAVKAREEAKAKFGSTSGSKTMVEENPVVAAFIKNVALVGLPDGVELKEGMNTKNVKPNVDSLADMLYSVSEETASKLFEAATSGLNNLSDISFEFETLEPKIKKNQDALNNYRKELEALSKSNKANDWNKMIEMYCIINTLRAQQCALIAAKSEYEFLTSTYKQTFVGSIQGYAQALFEIGFFILSTYISVSTINSLGKTAFVSELKDTISGAMPTIIPGFQSAMNEIMNKYVNPVTSNPIFMGAVVAGYTLLKGSEIQKELEFEQKEKFLLLALDQFVPLISAVNVSLATCETTSKTIMEKFNSKEWASETIFGDFVNASEDEKEEFIKRLKANLKTKFFASTLAEIKSEQGPISVAVNSMEVSTEIRSALTPDAIFNSPIRGEGGLYNFASALGLEGDWMKKIEDIFDSVEDPLVEDMEDVLVSEDIYTKYINKENPTHAALGGLIFIAQSMAIIKTPSDYMLPVLKFPPVPKVNIQSVKHSAQVQPIEMPTIPVPIDLTEPEVESCGVFVSIVDDKEKIYKSRIGMLYFEKGSPIIDTKEGTSGIDGFSQLLQDYKFNFVVVGNADVSGPQEKKRKGGFIGNRQLSEMRASSFFQSIKKIGDELYSILGCGKMYARNFTNYINKDFSTSKIAELEGTNKTDEKFKKSMADDRRIEIIIFPENVNFKTFANDDPLISKVCKKPYSEQDDDKLIRIKNGKWFISKEAESEFGMIFPKRQGKSTNESGRTYVMSFDSFLND